MLKRQKFKLRLSLTDRCNYRCSHCYASAGKSFTDMSFDLFTKIIDDLSPVCGNDAMVQLLGGEPLLYPQLKEAIGYVVHKGYSCSLTTNGALLTPDMAQLLSESGIQKVNVSLDGIETFHNSMRGSDRAFLSVMEALKNLKSQNIPCGLSVVVFRGILEHLPFLQGISDQFEVPINFKRFLTLGAGRGMDDMLATPEEITELGKYAIKNGHQYKELFFAVDGGQCKSCDCGVNLVYVQTDGTVWPCWRVQVPVGNMKVQPLKDILQNGFIKDFRNKGKLKGKCGSCIHREKCGGCPGVAFNLSGNYYSGDPQCPNWECIKEA